MSKKFLKFLIVTLIFHQIGIAEKNVPNILIDDNPAKEVSILKLNKTRDENYLEIKVKKIKSKEVKGILDKKNNILTLDLENKIEDKSNFYITDSTKVLREKKISMIGNKYRYKIGEDKKSLEIEGDNLDKTLYVVNYDKNTGELIKLYKYIGSNINQKEKRKILDLLVTDLYNNYDMVLLTKGRTRNGIEIIGGEIVELPAEAKEVVIYDKDKKIIEKIKVVSGNGEIGFGNDISGITLKDSKNYLKLGIGFENGFLKLKLKEWSNNSTTFDFYIEAEDKKEKLIQKVSIIPPKHKLQILTTASDFDFGTAQRGQVSTFSLTREMRIQVPNNVTNVKAELKDNGELIMKHEEGLEAQITAHLTIQEKVSKTKAENNRDNILIYKIDGEINEDISNKPAGTYSGKTQAIVSIE